MRFEKQKRDLENRIKNDPGDKDAYKHLALLMLRNGEIDAVFEYLLDKYALQFLLWRILDMNERHQSFPQDIRNTLYRFSDSPLNDEQGPKLRWLDYDNYQKDTYAFDLISSLPINVTLDKIVSLFDMDELSEFGEEVFMQLVEDIKQLDLVTLVESINAVENSLRKARNLIYDHMDKSAGGPWVLTFFFNIPSEDNAGPIKRNNLMYNVYMSEETLQELLKKIGRYPGITKTDYFSQIE